MVKTAKVKMKDLPALAKAHQYILKGRLSLQSRKRALASRGEEFELDWLIDTFIKLEDRLEGYIADAYKTHPIYPELSRVKGLGDELGGKLIGFIEAVDRRFCAKCGAEWKKVRVGGEESAGNWIWEQRCPCEVYETPEVASPGYTSKTSIACFDTLSRLWAFCGYGLPGKKVAGEKLNYNPELKAHLFKIAQSFTRSRNKFYEEVYLPRKDSEATKFSAVVPARKGAVKELPESVTTVLHIHQRAVRVMIKVFLGCLYYRWREIEGLPCRQTYAEEHLGHTARYKLEDFMD